MKNNKQPLISVIIPIYNVQDFLPACIESVLAQTYHTLQIILVNDGSTDTSGLICQTYAKRDSRILVLEQKNSGASSARNAGLSHAVGDYIIFIDSDDFWNSNKFLQELVTILTTSNCDIVTFPFQRCTENGTLIKNRKQHFPSNYRSSKGTASSYGKTLLHLVQHGRLNISACGNIYRAAMLKEQNFLFEEGLWSEDIIWFLKVLSAATSLTYTNLNAYTYRHRGSSITHAQNSKRCLDLFHVIDQTSQFLTDINCEPTIQRALLGSLAYEYYVLLGLKNYLHLSDNTVDLHPIRWVTSYSCDSKTILCRWLCRLVGEKTAGKLLGKIAQKKLEMSSSEN